MMKHSKSDANPANGVGRLADRYGARGLGLVGPIFPGVTASVLIGFAMSFSSTVFVVKILDELGATSARHGRIAIGVLVVQDIAAVVFIAMSMGKVPTPLALALIVVQAAVLELITSFLINRLGLERLE